MSCKTLPGLLYVEYIRVPELTLFPKKIIVPGDTVSAIGNWTNIRLANIASCEYTSERTDAGLVYTTRINGITYESEKQDNGMQHILQTDFHCYRITDVYRNEYLIGIDQKPFPEIVFTPSNESSPAGMRAVNFEITWISTLPPIENVHL